MAETLPAAASSPQHGIVQVLQRRHDGWTLSRQVAFIDALAEFGCVAHACREVSMGSTSAYRLKERSETFSAAWDQALEATALDLERIARDRVIHGIEERTWSAGKRVMRQRHSDRLLMFLLKAARPDKYGGAYEDFGGRGDRARVQRRAMIDARPMAKRCKRQVETRVRAGAAPAAITGPGKPAHPLDDPALRDLWGEELERAVAAWEAKQRAGG